MNTATIRRRKISIRPIDTDEQKGRTALELATAVLKGIPENCSRYKTQKEMLINI